MKLGRYEISVWEDYQMHRYKKYQSYDKDTGRYENYIGSIEESSDWVPDDDSIYYVPDKQWYDERCLAVIGSDLMTSECRASTPLFRRASNGEFDITFELYTRYFDKQELEFVDNPFIKLLTNERKIKLHLIEKNEWYDFVIKSIQENSDSKAFTYTAKALFINELAKNGLELVYDPELENSIGTIQELASRAVEGTDWIIDPDSELIQQAVNEPLYEIKLSKDIKAYNMDNKSTEKEISIAAGKHIYAFYSDITNQSSFLQFLYREDNNYLIDTDTQVINNSNNWYIINVKYEEGIPDIADIEPTKDIRVTDKFQGKKLVRSVKTEFEPLLNQLVYVYQEVDSEGQHINGEENIRRYTKYEYLSPTLVGTLVTNPNDFTDNTGWDKEGAEAFLPGLYPPLHEDPNKSLLEQMNEATLALTVKLNQGEHIHNTGLLDCRKDFVSSGIALDEKYVLRLDYLTENNSEAKLEGFVAFYDGFNENGTYKFNEINTEDGKVIDKIFDFSDSENLDKTGKYLTYVASAARAVTYQEMLRQKLGLFLRASGTATYVIYSVDLFKYYTNKEGIIYPESIVSDDLIKTIYYYYRKDDVKNLKDPNEIKYLYQGQLSQEDKYIPVYDEDCTKRRSLKISKSNRFNIIQELCELFECWAEFKIDHYENGKIIPGTKRIIFKNYIGKDNFAGFKYGINSKSIQRTIDSEQIVSKILVEENNNEYAVDGVCSVARAEDNPTGELFFYDFRYYYNQGLLKYSDVMNDLYLDTPNSPWLGYYKKLRAHNKKRLALIDELSSLSTSITELEAACQTYYLIQTEASEELHAKQQELFNYPVTKGKTYDPSSSKVDDELEEIIKKDPEAASMVTAISVLYKKYKTHEEMYNTYNKALNGEDGTGGANGRYAEINDELEDIKKEKDKLNKLFYTKYSRFIQEGSWSSEDYIDDNLYYYDAAASLAINANPQVTYTINVIDVSGQEGFEGYTFDVGDRTTIEDTEFFGWVLIDGVKTPVQEEIIVSEIIMNLDDPDATTIKVQNYKTKFEDMFQRINATTSSLQYQSGGFARAAAIVTATGEIKADTLQQSFDNNAFILSNAGDQTVLWDDSGITVSSPKTPSQIVRIVNGGIYITKDSGTTWNAAITGSGINASYINAGQIDTNMIRIMNGVWPTYRWDTNGLSAYSFAVDEQKQITGIAYNQYVRFDQYGLYGIHANENWVAADVQDIKDNATFALTWDGFYLNNVKYNGYLELSTDNDFVVGSIVTEELEGNVQQRVKKQRIKIGRFDNTYGIQIKDDSGAVVMETAANGTLWLKNSLHILTDNQAEIGIGYLGATAKPTQESEVKAGYNYGIPEVINAAGKFVVFEDGSFYGANAHLEDGYFRGVIHADSGTIGGVKIESITDSTKKLEITSSAGYIIKITNDGVSPEEIELQANVSGFSEVDPGFRWFITSDFTSLGEALGSSASFKFNYNTYKDYFNNDRLYVIVHYLDNKGDNKVDISSYVSLAVVRDGEKGKDGKDGENGKDGESNYSAIIESTNGIIFKNGEGTTKLICKIYKNNQLLPEDLFIYNWYSNTAPNTILSTNNYYDVDSIQGTETYNCRVSLKEEN